MQLLWLAPYSPVPTTGAGTRVYQLIKGLARNHDIDLIAGPTVKSVDDPTSKDLPAFCRSVELISAMKPSVLRKRLTQLASIASPASCQKRLHYSSEMQKRIHAALERRRYDAIILEHSFIGYYHLDGNAPVVLDQHNVESEILQRSAALERTWLRRAYNRLECRKYLRDEEIFCRRADLILTTSERDAREIEIWKGTPATEVIPNGVDTSFFTPAEMEPSESRVVFTGTMNYAPNADAMLHFVSEVWPSIRTEVPEAQLQIVGLGPPQEVLELGRLTDVTVTGFVPDVRPYLRGAKVVVAPLRIGGGTRLKILEAMAVGRPIVSTSLGCEGIDVQENRHLVIADDPSHFAASVVHLLDASAERSALGLAGRQLVQERYDWSSIASRMENAVRHLVNPRSRSAI